MQLSSRLLLQSFGPTDHFIIFFHFLLFSLLFFLLFHELFLESFLPLVLLPELDELDGGSLGDEEVGHADVPSLLRIILRFNFIASSRGLALRCSCHFRLLLLKLLFRSIRFILSLLVGCLDNGERQVEKEEGADEDHGHEEENGERRIHFLVHDHDFGPAFERDALEDIEERPENIVKIRHVEVGIQCLFATVIADRALC